MSRLGKKPILIPEGVEVKTEGQKIIVKGPKGELSKELSFEISFEIKDRNIFFMPKSHSKKTKSLWGLTRQIVNNMIKGVKDGYEKKLEIEGIGFRAQLEGDNLLFNIGFSHPVKIIKPDGIKFSVDKNIITVSGIDKELVGQVAADIKKIRKPEPYKGKGIRYLGEVIKRKMGKKAVSSTK